MKLLDKVCVVAGGSGAIGSAVARRLSAEGAHLALTYLTVKPENLCEELSRRPRRTACYRLDITHWNQVQSVIQQIRRDFGGIDVLVNCSGILGPIGPLETVDMQEWARLHVQYIDTASLLLDLKALPLTIPAVLSRRGAYWHEPD